MLSELLKNDIIMFGNICINHDDTQTNKLSETQENILKLICSEQRLLIKSARRQGKSLLALIHTLYTAIFYPNSNINYFVATHINQEIKIIEEFIFSLKNHSLVEFNVSHSISPSEIRFDNGSRIKFMSIKSPELGQKSINAVYIDEGLSIMSENDARNFWSNLLSITFSDTKIIAGSTKIKGRNGFNNLWDQENSGFTKTTMDWKSSELLTEIFKEDIINNIGLKNWNKEFEIN